MLNLFFTNIDQFIIFASIFLFSISFHEFAHGFVANAIGDDTAKISGRLTINPFAHLDLFGAIFFLIAGFGFAKPVPINPARFSKVSVKTGIFLVSLAGPLANLFLATIFWFPFRFAKDFFQTESFSSPYYLAMQISYYLALINISLASFNLLPIPPLDGSKILESLTMNKLYNFWWELEKKGSSLLLILIFVSYATNGVLNPIGWFVDIVSIPFRFFVFGI